MKRPFRIGLVMQGGASWIGGSEYVKNLIVALASQESDVRSGFEIFLICGQRLDEHLRQYLQSYLSGFIELGEYFSEVNPLFRLRLCLTEAWSKNRNARFASVLKARGIDFTYPITYDNVYNLGVNLPLSINNKNCRWAGWIPDFQHKHMPHMFNEGEIQRRNRNMEILAREASCVVLSSRNAETDCIKFYPESSGKTAVFPFLTPANTDWYQGNPYAVCAKYHLPERFLLLSNQFWKHKNHLLVFNALQILAGQSIFPNIVCTGQPHDFRDKDYFNSILGILHELGIACQVFLLGLIPKNHQMQIARASLAMVQPSLFEGWSTVVEDARVLGKPILLSDIPVHREQNPRGADYFDPHSAHHAANSIARAWRELSPGPDVEMEKACLKQNLIDQQEMGAKFLTLAKSHRSIAAN